MAQDFGNGVSRTLSALQRQFQNVVWQAGKPPLDAELNLVAQIGTEALRDSIRSQMHSGFLVNPMSADTDFVTNAAWSNWFKIGRPASGDEAPPLWANVNGWIIPVTGTGVADGDVSNRVNLYPPPSTDARVDFVFLEVWQAQVAPNPSTANKPSASTVWTYGNVKFGGTNIADDIEDPTVGFETTERVQIQYRLRVVGEGAGLGASVDLAQYPDGLDDPNVLAQGAETGPVAGYAFANMGAVLGDKGLWRAGTGDATSRANLGTVDGYVYAIPVCAVFRRNTNPFVARINSGNANQNGSFNRNPVAGAITDPVQATRTFTTVTLTADLDATTTGVVSVSGLSGSGWDNGALDWAASGAIRLGDEIVVITAIDTVGSTITIAANGRGRFGSQAAVHAAGTGLGFFNFRPDGRFADEIAPADVLDLRRSVTPGGWDYDGLLLHNLGRLFDGTLRASYKQGNGTDTQGTQIIEVDTYLGAGAGSLPNQTEQLDGFDGIRTVFSDAVTVQNDVSLILSPVTSGGNPTAVADYTAGAAAWDVAAPFLPAGFQSNAGGWANGTSIDLFLGGASGSQGARATSTTGDRFMRFVSPREYWLSRDTATGAASGTLGNQMPFLLRFLEEAWSNPAGIGETATPGPMFPLPEFNFERPFIVLGGVVNTLLSESSATTVSGAVDEIQFPGLDFDVAGDWFPATGGVATTSTEGITNLLLNGTRNLYDLLTAGGRDLSGQSSELYVVLSGDTANAGNAGVFRVIGAGTAGYTTVDASTADALVIEQVGVSTGGIVNGQTVTAKVRSQYMTTEDGPGSGDSAATIVITDIGGVANGSVNPWNGEATAPVTSQAVLDTSILYGPSRGAMARVADRVARLAVVDPTGLPLLREAPEDVDPDPAGFRARTGVPEDEHYYTAQPLQTWNRLPSLGQHAPLAPAYGEGRIGFDTYRESEAFVDTGSKTLVFRPFRQADMSLYIRQASGAQIPTTYTAGAASGSTVDGAGLFDTDEVGAVPPEFMPRFGRQDIPVRTVAGDGMFFGVNHLFGDSTVATDNELDFVGGTTTTGATPLKIVTGASSGLDYGQWNAGNSWYQGRLYEDVNARSSDLNHPLRGIQLPPFLGVARVYGIYDKRDYDTNGSAWSDQGFTPDGGPTRGTNLLRTAADRQTLFIVKGGAADVFSDPLVGSGAHTYVIPEDAIDITLSPNYDPTANGGTGEVFNDLEYVVEVRVFGFARGFIDQNNYVLLRADSTQSPPDLVSDVSMVIPAPMPSGVQAYTAYLRTVYQGDPYMTRDGATLQTADYEHRYGQIPTASAYQLTFPVQQYDTDNDPIPETPNPRALEVLAVADFWTTLGTGKVGGPVSPGTVTDNGYLAAPGTRIPSSQTEQPWQPEPRALTEGQPSDGQNFAFVDILIFDNGAITTESVTIEDGSTTVTLVGNTDFSVGSDAATTALNLTAAVATDNELSAVLRVRAIPMGNVIRVQSTVPGRRSPEVVVTIGPAGSNAAPNGMTLLAAGTTSPLLGGANVPVNGKRGMSATTPRTLAGMTDRLPLGILVNDADFIGEDPLRKGVAYEVRPSGGAMSTEAMATISPDGEEYARLSGPAGFIALVDGAVLDYTAYNAGTAPAGTKKFRIYRGGGAAYVLNDPAGGPLDFTAGGWSDGDDPVLKGAVLAGRAYLVRNGYEEAFAGNVVRSYGDELQMVIVTHAIPGEGLTCDHGYALDGIISPADFGKGYAAADRYRLEGKPLIKSSADLPDPDVPLAPYPPEDPAPDDVCP